MKKLLLLFVLMITVTAQAAPPLALDAGSSLRPGMLVSILLHGSAVIDTYRGQTDSHLILGASCLFERGLFTWIAKDAVVDVVPMLAPEGKIQTMTCELHTEAR